MKKTLYRLFSLFLAVVLLTAVLPAASAQEVVPDLSGYIRNGPRRHFVESMLSYYLRENTAVRNALQDGYCAMFFFEGCSDNMDDPELSDLSYYRVSAVCVVLKLDDAGIPRIVYFNDDCSTLPDRPLDYGAWQFEEVGEVGPATICDGTYSLYSVMHGGAYEALHMQTDAVDDTISAIYMTPDGAYTPQRATMINIHTRTGNHVLRRDMWSAGCLLVGEGNYEDFVQLMEASYYSCYAIFETELPVGSVTVNRQWIQEEMYHLYENPEAVDVLLASSRCDLPEIYLERCTQKTPFQETKIMRTVTDAKLMTLPCSNGTDARSIPVATLSAGDRLELCGSIVNTAGNMWYEVNLLNQNCYIYSEDVEEIPPTLWERIVDYFQP